ncbi:hypothetical protein [Mycobacterium uberis]|uniref:hypothetical protein n=1 Tax=Mycobacterium uberis TaxID=2162698 RepID=UPI001FB23180|nr:hypothetical protein [Mycobacterium uberis]
MTRFGGMGYFDNSGRLYIVGSEDDMIVSGSENMYPRTLKMRLQSTPVSPKMRSLISTASSSGDDWMPLSCSGRRTSSMRL